MLMLELSNAACWLDLLPGVRLKLRPVTPALMISARADPAVEVLPCEATTEEPALAMAKAVAQRAVLEWDSGGDAGGTRSVLRPRASTCSSKSGPPSGPFKAIYVANGFFWSRKKTPRRPRRLVLRRGGGATAAALRWSDDNPARSQRLQPFGGGMLEMPRHEGFLIPSRVEPEQLLGLAGLRALLPRGGHARPVVKGDRRRTIRRYPGRG